MIAGNIPGRTQTLSLGIYQEVMMGDAEFAGLYALILFVLATGITAVVHVIEDRIAEPSGRGRG
ncbi:hypothetical protein [Spirochaeta thermophila]|uniref:Uncharacterized protein n=1 Tax=Winmispira thermophila (strain ATCC 49972 / DSM 6192 / RI 19.B1) TaxID=665571 RepID=E0RPC1_WINT6|nr:hypothetical protein [Spirochaeta thermophila]ADN01315.1 hypothetical protein STHERM_c03420 [Spirochaeta thermophila DSM 6192]